MNNSTLPFDHLHELTTAYNQSQVECWFTFSATCVVKWQEFRYKQNPVTSYLAIRYLRIFSQLLLI